MSSLRRSLLAAAATVLVLPAALARADWGPAVPVTGSHEDAYTVGLAANRADRTAVLFQTRRPHRRWTLKLRRGDARARLGRAVVLSTGRHQVEGAGLFAGSGGDLVAGWLEIVNRSRRPVVATGPHLEHRQVLAPGPRSTQIMRIAANRRGDAVVAFWRYYRQTYSIYGAVRSAGHRFGSAEPIVTGNVSFSSLAIDQAGNAVIGWIDGEGVHVAVRPAGANAFNAPVLVAADKHLRGDPGLAIDGDHVVVSWVAEDLDGNRTLLVSETSGGAPFGVPRALTRPGVRLPHWLTPSVLVDSRRVLVAWVQGRQHTTAHDAAALAERPSGGPWQEPVLRGVRSPAHVYAVSLVAPAPGRPALLGLTTARSWRFSVATSTVRRDGTLGPVRVPATGRSGGFRPYLAQGRRHTWLATERDVGHDRLQRRQVLLFRSN